MIATVTLPLSQFEEMRRQITELENQLEKLRNAVVTVYGPEKSNALMAEAERIEDSKRRAKLHGLVMRGEL